MSTVSRFLALLALSSIASGVISCASVNRPVHSSVPSAIQWKKVSDDPTTFFPPGHPPESPKTYKDGEWVWSGSGETRWFIPKKGAGGHSQMDLLKDALAARQRSLSVEQKAGVGVAQVGKAAKKSTEVAAKSAATFIMGLVPGTGEAVSEMWSGTFD